MADAVGVDPSPRRGPLRNAGRGPFRRLVGRVGVLEPVFSGFLAVLRGLGLLRAESGRGQAVLSAAQRRRLNAMAAISTWPPGLGEAAIADDAKAHPALQGRERRLHRGAAAGDEPVVELEPARQHRMMLVG